MSDGPRERCSPVNAIPVGGRFFHHRVMQVMNQGSYTVAKAVYPPSEIRRYYDPVTARKAGEFSWDTSVEVLG